MIPAYVVLAGPERVEIGPDMGGNMKPSEILIEALANHREGVAWLKGGAGVNMFHEAVVGGRYCVGTSLNKVGGVFAGGCLTYVDNADLDAAVRYFQKAAGCQDIPTWNDDHATDWQRVKGAYVRAIDAAQRDEALASPPRVVPVPFAPSAVFTIGALITGNCVPVEERSAK